MKCAIMQPTYMPWAGYFNLISQVDHFVFLDDVQFVKRSWQCRNRILVNKRVTFITVPVYHKNKPLIKTVKINYERHWRYKHYETIKHNYRNHPYYQEVENNIQRFFHNSRYLYLARLNMAIIKDFSKLLGLNPIFWEASKLNVKGKRSEHLLEICKKLSCNQYISPIGSKDYLLKDNVFKNSSIELIYQNYTPLPYVQKGVDGFIGYLSIIDVLANIGIENTKKYISMKYTST